MSRADPKSPFVIFTLLRITPDKAFATWWNSSLFTSPLHSLKSIVKKASPKDSHLEDSHSCSISFLASSGIEPAFKNYECQKAGSESLSRVDWISFLAI